MTVEQVKALREAFVAGVEWEVGGRGKYIDTHRAEAAIRYPMPMVEVPRVWQESDNAFYRVRGNEIEYGYRNEEGKMVWIESTKTERMVRALVELLDSPTEQLPADEVPNA